MWSLHPVLTNQGEIFTIKWVSLQKLKAYKIDHRRTNQRETFEDKTLIQTS